HLRRPLRHQFLDISLQSCALIHPAHHALLTGWLLQRRSADSTRSGCGGAAGRGSGRSPPPPRSRPAVRRGASSHGRWGSGACMGGWGEHFVAVACAGGKPPGTPRPGTLNEVTRLHTTVVIPHRSPIDRHDAAGGGEDALA